ncbi:MAG TPA: methyltransferase domain-containing protein [Candidatus Dormibacteraeota bacterium]|nr:methyltransferase domain-containing protein [Candidatus Dormibacteraeota bacterium]
MTTATESAGPARACPICGGRTAPAQNGMYDDRYGHPGLYDWRRCTRCGHTFIDAEFTTEELGQLYSDWYPRATQRYEDLPPLARTTGFAAWLGGERHAAHSWVPRDVAVLDIGCSFGRTLALHVSRGCTAVGVEADAHAVAEARRQGLSVTHGLFDPAAYAPASFDYVTMDQVLEHANDPVAFLRGVAFVLKPGGIAVISTPNVASYGAKIFGARWINWHTPYHLNLFTKSSLRRLAGDVGFEVRSIRTITASAWLRYQWIQLFTRPQPGEPHPFWDPKRSPRRLGRWVRISARLLDKAKAFHVVTRVADGLGGGDNLLAILVKPVRR